jgi:ABC-type histidine transport system ATPase subunit
MVLRPLKSAIGCVQPWTGGLAEQENLYPIALSGGEQQRVSARAWWVHK